MKTLLLATMLAFAVAARADEPSVFSSAASYRAADCARFEASYLPLFESDNPGVVESALGHVTLAKMICPAWCLTRMEKKLERLAMKGDTPSIRYKAYLALMVFESPKIFSAESLREYASGDELFKAVSQRLTGTVLAADLK